MTFPSYIGLAWQFRIVDRIQPIHVRGLASLQARLALNQTRYRLLAVFL